DISLSDIYYPLCFLSSLFFFTFPPSTELYTLSLHDALPIYQAGSRYLTGSLRRPIDLITRQNGSSVARCGAFPSRKCAPWGAGRSEEHTSELQSHLNLVCRLLLEKKKNMINKESQS